MTETQLQMLIFRGLPKAQTSQHVLFLEAQISISVACYLDSTARAFRDDRMMLSTIHTENVGDWLGKTFRANRAQVNEALLHRATTVTWMRNARNFAQEGVCTESFLGVHNYGKTTV